MIDVLYYDVNMWKCFYKRMKIKNQTAEEFIEEMNSRGGQPRSHLNDWTLGPVL